MEREIEFWNLLTLSLSIQILITAMMLDNSRVWAKNWKKKSRVEGYWKMWSSHPRVLFKMYEHCLEYLQWNDQETFTDTLICCKIAAILWTVLLGN